MDFYYTPYDAEISAKKWMNFSNGYKGFFNQNDPLSKQISPQWGLIREFIMKTDAKTIKNIERHNSLQQKTSDYMKKLDLIDSHPNLYMRKKRENKMTNLEIDMIRTLVNNS